MFPGESRGQERHRTALRCPGPRLSPGNETEKTDETLETLVAQLLRAATFLGSDPAATRSDRPMPHRVMGNGLRELDIFLVDILALAHGTRRARRVYCAAEAWRRAEPGRGLANSHHAALVQLRAAQNRMAFAPSTAWMGPPYPLALACATYGIIARTILATALAGAQGQKRTAASDASTFASGTAQLPQETLSPSFTPSSAARPPRNSSTADTGMPADTGSRA